MSGALHHSKDAFEFSDYNKPIVHEIINRYPEGRQASAVIPLLDLAQRQNNGWIDSAIIEEVANILSMPVMKVYEVASFYSMFNFKPVGRNFVQVCGTTPCWLRGSADIIDICKKKIGEKGNVTSDGNFSWNEVECLGACANAPMVQINDIYYEDLNKENFEKLLDDIASGKKVRVGPQSGRQGSSPNIMQKDFNQTTAES